MTAKDKLLPSTQMITMRIFERARTAILAVRPLSGVSRTAYPSILRILSDKRALSPRRTLPKSLVFTDLVAGLARPTSRR